MAGQNVLRQIKLVVYRLKREFGIPLTLLRPLQNDHDVETGVITRQWEEYNILRAVVLPVDTARKFSYDLSFIAANRNFVYGGFYDNKDRIILIDAKDIRLNDGQTIEVSWRIRLEDEYYEVSHIEEAQRKSAFMIRAKHTTSVTE